MRPAVAPIQRPPDAKLLVVDARGRFDHAARSDLVRYLEPGDLLVGNDAATIPASLTGRHEPTGAPIEIRLAGRRSLEPGDVREFIAVVFGAGGYWIRTEDRPAPPPIAAGDELVLGPLRARVTRVLDHPRLIALELVGDLAAIWRGIARHGQPIQYAHMAQPLALWDVWTRIAAVPAAFEPPSAGFVVDWTLLAALGRRGVRFATLTHAAGISSTGDAGLDRRLPFDEPYWLPFRTVRAIEATRAEGGRVIALGTSVTRALEHAAGSEPALRPGPGVAGQRIDARSTLRVVDAILTGTHEPGSSHYDLLRAFAGETLLARISAALERHGYRTHEFGDSVLLDRQPPDPRIGLEADRYSEGSELALVDGID
jgi:S-adenosylmethionine:tRNA ribosyltransferase-isomerase